MKEQGRAQCLIAFGCRHLAIGGQMGQERLHLDRTHFARMPHRTAVARPANGKPLPVDIDLLGPDAKVLVAYALAQPIQQTGRR